MFVYTVTKKRALRVLLLALALIVGIIIGIVAILTAVNTAAEERKIPIYCVEREDQKIALTFDCAWGNSNTDELLSLLAAENVRATFFVTGEFCDKYPEDVLKIFRAGHEIENHSDKHPHIEGININDLILDTKECARKIRDITGVAPTLYRAPYGEFDNNSIFTIEGMGYKYIQWSVDSVDWQEPDAKTIISRVVKGANSGSILLFHNDLENTTEALPQTIAKLKQKGFEFVPVSSIIYTDNYKIDNTGKQIYLGNENSATAVIHTSSATVNSALELMLDNLTLEEIKSLENGLTPEVGAKLSGMLSSEQIGAVMNLSDDELKAVWGALVEAKAAQAMQSALPVGENEIEGENTTLQLIENAGDFGKGAGDTLGAEDVIDNAAPNNTETAPENASANIPETIPEIGADNDEGKASADFPDAIEGYISEYGDLNKVAEAMAEQGYELPVIGDYVKG